MVIGQVYYETGWLNFLCLTLLFLAFQEATYVASGSGMTSFEPVTNASTFIRVISDPGGGGMGEGSGGPKFYAGGMLNLMSQCYIKLPL
jgi:hypothetical protein